MQGIPVGVLARVGRSALDNARLSLEQISSTVEIRRRLLVDPADQAGPGDLVRLSPAECHELLRTRTVGRLAYIARPGMPDIVPVNYVLSGDCVLIRSGPGPKLQAAERREVVAFEVDDLDDEGRCGWSVVLHGTAERVPTAELAEEGPAPWASGPRRHLLRIVPRRLDGRRLL